MERGSIPTVPYHISPSGSSPFSTVGLPPSSSGARSLAAARACGALARTKESWEAHPQGKALSDVALIETTRVLDSAPEPAGDGQRPMGGVRVLELARILAGPTSGRLLAEHGADVLMVSGPFVPHVMRSVLDTNHGKRSTYLDVAAPEQRELLLALARSADVVIDGYRPGVLEAHGFGASELAAIRPGLIHLSVSCYGDVGPWRSRAGFEPLAESATGLAVRHARAERPRVLPAAACDYLTGFLGALGVVAALVRRAREGGSYQVRVSLARTAMWLMTFPELPDTDGVSGPEDLSEWMMETVTRFGVLTHLAPVARLSLTPGRYTRPNPPIGSDPPAWSE
jgi:CoA-transferase family III